MYYNWQVYYVKNIEVRIQRDVRVLHTTVIGTRISTEKRRKMFEKNSANSIDLYSRVDTCVMQRNSEIPNIFFVLEIVYTFW